jgi:competence protein CoiA
MQFASVNGVRQPPSPKRAGVCLHCGAPALAKCGPKLLWHWAHRGKRHCDPWWENETPWHRSWKERFPQDWRERVHFDAGGERHIADVKTSGGVVLEFQNSPMALEELRARERFYENMIWIVNGASFASHFFVLGRLPAPTAPWVADLTFVREGSVFWRRAENPESKREFVLVHSMDEIQHRIDRDYVGHHHYDWVRPRSVWLEAQAPVYIDFGGDVVWHVTRYGDRDLRCVRAIRTRRLAAQHGGVYAEVGAIGATAVRPRGNMSVVYKGEDEVLLSLIG